MQQPAQTAQQTDAVAQQIAAADAGVNAPKPAAAPAMDNPVYVTAGEMPHAAGRRAEEKRLPGLDVRRHARLGRTAPLVNTRSGEQPAVQAKPAPAAAKPIITLASADSTAKPVQLASLGGDTSHITGSDALPGVRQTALFEIKRKSGLDDESDVDLNEDEGPRRPYQVASAAGLARLAPNGLLKQNESVDVACLKPSLVRVLKTIEGHYGRKMVVTSGYRDPARNRRANGAKNSLHMYCAAADIQVPGVSQMGTGELHQDHARPRRRRHLLPHRIRPRRRRPRARLELALPPAQRRWRRLASRGARRASSSRCEA